MQTQVPTQQYRRPESVLVIVYGPGKQVLLLERCKPEAYWQSVTGSLETGETPEHCARRELFEETGIKAQPVNTGIVNRFSIMPQWRARYAPEVNENTEYVFSLRLEQEITPVLSPQEHTRFAWLDIETATHWCFSHTNADAIERILLG